MNLYSKRRERLGRKLASDSITVIFSSDAEYEPGSFTINRNFYYLTGIDKESMALVLVNNAGELNEYMFILPYDQKMARWIGGRLLPEKVKELSDVENIRNINELDAFVEKTIKRNRANPNYRVYLDLFNREDEMPTRASLYAQKILSKYPNILINDVFYALTRLRLIKDDYEITCIKQAIGITKQGVVATMRSIQPGVNEMVMEGVFALTLNQNICNEFAFKTIAASGKRATVLHYQDNNQLMKSGELFLQDCGACFKHYCSDITRTFPVNGKFTARQKELYQVVLNAQKLVEENAKPGVRISDLTRLVTSYYKQELPKYGLVKPVSEYFWHEVSHHIGLDCHDADDGLGATLEVGNVISCEPGLYIADEGIGIRIEDDLLITSLGCQNLSKDIIKEVDDIEKLMARH